MGAVYLPLPVLWPRCWFRRRRRGRSTRVDLNQDLQFRYRPRPGPGGVTGWTRSVPDVGYYRFDRVPLYLEIRRVSRVHGKKWCDFRITPTRGGFGNDVADCVRGISGLELHFGGPFYAGACCWLHGGGISGAHAGGSQPPISFDISQRWFFKQRQYAGQRAAEDRPIVPVRK